MNNYDSYNEHVIQALTEIQVPQRAPLQGSALQIYPGYLFNSWSQVYLQWREKDESLFIMNNPESKMLMDVIPKSSVDSIEASKKNPLVFKLYLHTPSSRAQYVEFIFKVLGEQEERDNWVTKLREVIPTRSKAVPKEVEMVDFTGQQMVVQLYPGMLYNGFRNIFLKFIADENSLVLYEDAQEKTVLETIFLSSAEFVSASRKNQFAFSITMKPDNQAASSSWFSFGGTTQPAPPVKHFFKVLTTVDDRDRWVSLLSKKIAPIQQPNST